MNQAEVVIPWDIGGGISPGMSDARVLVVDDQPERVALVSRILRRAGLHHVWGFTDPDAALAAIGDWDPDLVVLDLHMLGLDGVAFLNALHADAVPEDFLPVLVLTADDSKASMRSALAAGANDYATKPLDPDEVLVRVRNLLSVRLCHEKLKTDNAELAAELRAHTRLDREHAADDQHMVDRIAEQIGAGGPEMVFQPIIDLRTSERIGYESLARFTNGFPPQPPEVWFAEAAAVGLGVDLEMRAIATALQRLDDVPHDSFCALNLSPATMVSRECTDLLAQFSTDRIVLEITEHQLIDDYVELIGAVGRLRNRGVRISVDDAGAGFASFKHILKLSPDFIKLDTGLTRDIDTDPIKRALAPALVGFAAEIGAYIIAEGIETHAELATLRELGVAYGQGYLIAHPAPLEQILGERTRPTVTDRN